MELIDLTCRCSDPSQPRCGHHALQALRMAQNQMALATQGCDQCKPTDDVGTLALTIKRCRDDWLESAEGRLVCRGIVLALPAGPLQDQVAAVLRDAEARMAERATRYRRSMD